MTGSSHYQRALSLVNNFSNLNQVVAGGVLTMVSGHGVFVWDCEGREYLDAVSGLWSTSLGFSEPELVAVAIDQFGRLPSYHIAADKVNAPANRAAANTLSPSSTRGTCGNANKPLISDAKKHAPSPVA